MPNIVKGFYITFFSLFLSVSGQSQIVLENNQDWDVNGEVYTVVDFPFFDEYYILAGDFDSITGLGGLNNIVFIEKSSGTPFDPGFISSIDGPIYDVGVDEYILPVLPVTKKYNIYIGGNFTTVNSISHNSIVRFIITDDNVPPYPALSSASQSGWDPQLDIGPVRDIEVHQDTLYYAGDFNEINGGAVTADFRFGLTAINPATGNDLGLFQSYAPCNSPVWRVKTLEVTENRILVGGKTDPVIIQGGSFFRFLKNGCLDTGFDGEASFFAGPGPGWVANGLDVAIANDTVYSGIYQWNSNPTAQWWAIDTTNYGPPSIIQTPNNPSGITTKPSNSIIQKEYNNTPPPSGVSYENVSVAAYKDRIYTIRNVSYSGGGPFPITGTIFATDSGGTAWNSFGFDPNFSDYDQEHIFVVDNILFVSNNMTMDYFGSSRTGLISFCLEPMDAEDFIDFDTTICQGDTVTFEIPAVEYASGYEWSFSGSGVDIGVYSGSPTDTFIDLDSSKLDIAFLENFIPGTLTITPYSNCNNLISGKAYSKSISINISTNPLPNAVAGLDTIINCYNDSVVLFGYSDTLGVTYSWNQEINNLFQDSIGQNYVAHDSDNYILRVEAPNGCLNFDTVFVDYDKTTPTFDPVNSGILGCNDTIYFLGHCNNTTDTISWWEKQGDATQLSNPLECTTPGLYNFYTIDTINGCQGNLSPTLNVAQVIAGPNIELTGYSGLPPLGVNLDTLNCTDTFFNLSLYSDTVNAVLNWVDSDTLNPIGDTQVITSPGIYYIEAYNTNNNCYNYNQVFIDIDTLSPTVLIDSPSALNCSNSSVDLNGTVYPDYVLQWDGASIPSSPNPVTVTVSEYYTLTITDTTNGCINQDSVFVVQDNSIDIITSNDTAVCDQFAANVNANYVGTITGITYLWDNSETTSNATYTGGDDDYAIIEIFGDAGCYGTDTIFIGTPPTPVMEFTGYQPCGSPTSGYIVVNPISGWAPFDYSTDGGTNYQSSATLSGLTLGTHTVTVRDSLNCVYDFPATISETSSIATPEFLFQTYNYQSDTVIVIDVSNPATDSVDWYFSPEIVLLDENNGSPIIILPDTGSFLITMDAYYGTCISTITKEIFVSELDTNSANPYNDNGIKSISLYPNPTSGTFTVDVEFFNSQTATLSVQDMLGYVYDIEEHPESLVISQTFSMASEIDNGTYILRVLSEFDSAYITFILNR